MMNIGGFIATQIALRNTTQMLMNNIHHRKEEEKKRKNSFNGDYDGCIPKQSEEEYIPKHAALEEYKPKHAKEEDLEIYSI